MKKLFLFFVLLAGIAVLTGCKKDQDVVTLQAVIDQETKAYFSDDNRYLPYWNAGDEVNINGTRKSLSLPDNPTTFASIEGVATSDYYCAIYPYSAVDNMGAPSGTTNATIYFHNHQQYVWESGHQRVDMPMGAVTTDADKTLIFRNLCSILRLNVSNNLSTDFCVKRITVTSFGGYVAGYFDVTLSYNSSTHQTDVPGINPSSLNSNSEDNTLSLHVPNKTIAHGTSEPFDVVVPPFNARYLILEAELYTTGTNGTKIGYTSDTVAIVPDTWERTEDNSILDAINGTVSVERNKIVTIDFGVNTVTDDVIPFDYGYLEPGPDFNQHMKELIGNRTDITEIMFLNGAVNAQQLISERFIDEHGNIDNPTPRNGWVDVSTSDSPHKIYAHIEGNMVKIYSWADFIYANTNCDSMFKDLTTIQGIQWTTSRDRGFQSEDVNSMAYMFAGCEQLQTLVGYNSYDSDGQAIADPDGKFYLNTTNVTNMEHMFDGCIALNNLYLDFNTHNVIGDGMVAMFSGCTSLSSLNISSFTTERITNMTDLFNGCTSLATLHIDKFDMSNVSNPNKKDMFKNTANTKSVYDPCTVYCTGGPDGAETAITTQDANGNYYSGLDDSSTGNYYPQLIWVGASQVVKRKIVFARPTSK